MFQYYLKIVPTMFVKLDGSVLHTNQFSVTRHQKSVSAYSGESGMPGIFFSYEISPLMVKYTERERAVEKFSRAQGNRARNLRGLGSFGHFATSVCAIVGGVFTAAGILDAFLYHSVKAIEKNYNKGQ